MSLKAIVVSTGVLLLALVGLVFLITAGQNPSPPTASYVVADRDRPIAKTEKTFFDIGDIKLSDVKQQDFTLKNTGSKPLQILNVTTSCGCTAGQIIANGQSSKEFGMHNQSGFVTEIAPGGTATVRLTYRPASMPVNGLVTREVYVTTNDPQNQRLVFSIQAKVN